MSNPMAEEAEFMKPHPVTRLLAENGLQKLNYLVGDYVTVDSDKLQSLLEELQRRRNSARRLEEWLDQYTRIPVRTDDAIDDALNILELCADAVRAVMPVTSNLVRHFITLIEAAGVKIPDRLL